MVWSRQNWPWFLLLLGVGFLIFGNGLSGQFVRDDNIVLSHSIFNTPWNFFKFFGEPYFEGIKNAGLYRPLTQISFALNFLFSPSPAGFHLANILLHTVNSFLVFLLLKKLLNSSRLGLITALLFLVLPIHVEAVTSIVGRAEILAFFFSLLALLTWRDFNYSASAIFILLALLSKEGAIAIPAVAFAFSLFYKRNFRWLWHYTGSVLVFFSLRIAVLGKYAFGAQVEYIFNPLAHVSLAERLLTGLKLLVFYIQKTFVPYNLSADYSYSQIPLVKNIFTSPAAMVGLTFLLAAAYFSFKSLKTKKHLVIFVALVIFILFYLPISNLIVPIGTIMGDRLMYFPSLGLLILVAAGVDKLSNKKAAVLLILTPILLYWGIMTVRQNTIWKNEQVLHEDMYRKSPNSVVAKTHYGRTILNQDRETAKQLAQEAYRTYPGYVENLNLLGDLAVLDGDMVRAVEFLEQALELRPRNLNTMLNLSRVYFAQAKYHESEALSALVVTDVPGEGNVIFYALMKIKNHKYQEAFEIVVRYFGEDNSYGPALTIMNYARLKLGLPVNQKSTVLEREFKELVSSFDYSN